MFAEFCICHFKILKAAVKDDSVKGKNVANVDKGFELAFQALKVGPLYYLSVILNCNNCMQDAGRKKMLNSSTNLGCMFVCRRHVKGSLVELQIALRQLHSLPMALKVTQLLKMFLINITEKKE